MTAPHLQRALRRLVAGKHVTTIQREDLEHEHLIQATTHTGDLLLTKKGRRVLEDTRPSTTTHQQEL